jgi:hypothetical protein
MLGFVNALPGPLLTTLVTGLGLAAIAVLGLAAAIRVAKFKRELSDIFGPTSQKMVQQYAIDTGRATEQTGRFGKAVATAGGMAQTARGKIRGAGSSIADMAGFLTGPVGLSLTAATTYVGIFGQKTAEQKARVQVLTDALAALNDEFKDLTAQGKSASEAADMAFRNAVGNSPALQQAVVTLRELGVSVEDMIRAASSGDPSAMVKKLNDEIERQQQLATAAKESNTFLGMFGGNDENAKAFESAEKRIVQLTDMRDAFVGNAKAMGLTTEAQKILNAQEERHNAILAFRRANPTAAPWEIQAQTDAYTRNSERIQVLTDLVAAFGAGQENAQLKANAMRAAIDLETGALVAANEASEAWNSQLISLSEAVAVNGKTVDENSRQGLANRDAIQAAATAAKNFYLEEIASGKPIDDVTRLHGERITALREEAKRLGIAGSETDELIKLYGEVPEDVMTVYKTDQFKKVYDELKQLKFIQEALQKGWSADKAMSEWNKNKFYSSGQQGPFYVPKKATGGRISGPGTGTSDDVLMYGSNGEWVHRAASVNYYGDDFMSAINNMSIPKEWLPGFSTGGKVVGGDGASQVPAYARGGKVLPWDAKIDLSKTLIPSLDEIMAGLGSSGGALGGGSGGQGWRWQMKVLRAVFPGLDLYSGFRKNSYTDSGGLSWHSRDGGRAVDIPPRMDVFNWIHDNYGKGTKELIWGGDPGRNIHHGKHYRFSDSLLRNHGPYKGKRGKNPHIHWAFDEGGWMMPGMQGVNLLREPEPVLTPWQWDAIESFVNQGMSSAQGATYNFEFADTTLTPDRLNAIQQRQDALARVGRPR